MPTTVTQAIIIFSVFPIHFFLGPQKISKYKIHKMSGKHLILFYCALRLKAVGIVVNIYPPKTKLLANFDGNVARYALIAYGKKLEIT